jgi:S1-C subfamily serine protease
VGDAAKPKLPTAKTALDAAVRQIVMLERGGRPIAVGIPLNNDGRILTALSPLTHGNQIMARYPEGQLIPVKLSHSDRGWDLALLTPLGDARRSGLKASHDPAPAVGTKLHALNYVRDKQLGSTDITLKSKSTLRGGDSAQLADVYELPFALKPTDAGAPLVDDQGNVVAVVARACSVNDKAGCTLAPYAAPVSAVREFLRSAPRRNAWLGLDVVAFDAGFARGVRVATVAADGPAASSGLRAGPPGVGDVVLAVDGKPVASPEAFAEAVDKREAGAPARLTVLSDGRYREVSLSTFSAPEPPTLAPVRSDRVYKSNPSGVVPSPVAPTSVPNPYR